MPIPLKYDLKRISKEVRLKSSLKDNDTHWMAWWYCGIYKNDSANTQPNILIAFRELSGRMLSDEVIFRRVPLTSLGQVRVGTVWKNSMCRAEVVFDTEDFTVDFTKNMWSYTSFYDAFMLNDLPPYPQNIHRLSYQNDKNRLIKFRLPTGEKLLVPCLEFFSRCYGRSQELKRILATHSWCGGNDTQNSLLYAPIDEPEEPKKWKVRLKDRLVNDDVIFLAHAKYDRYAEWAAKNINAQIESLYDPENKIPAFIDVCPWFQELAMLRVKGIWFDDGRSFLALQVIGCSDPEGVPIQRDRTNTNKTDAPANDDESGTAWSGAPEKIMNNFPEIINLTGDAEPDQGSATVEIMDPDFVVLGKPRIVIDVRRGQAKNKAGNKTKDKNSEVFASGEPYGDGKGIGYASIQARTVLESRGMLRDMWDALLYFQNKRTKQIQMVEWFTFEDGFCSDADPNLIELQPFDNDIEMDRAIRNWPYLDAKRKIPRGVLVVRVMMKEKIVYFIEIQRKFRKKNSGDENKKNSEEAYTGFAFVLDEQNSFYKYLRSLLSEIREHKGVFKKISGKCPGNATAFAHKRSSHETIPCWSAIINAFCKLKLIESKLDS